MNLHLKNWYDKFFTEVKKAKKLRIISPFVKEQVVRQMENYFDFKNFELITKFSLRDFASNVSSLEALAFAVERGARIYGIKDLHSKIYLFDNHSAIISSANLTLGGLQNNYECGLQITDKTIIKQLHDYFNQLKKTSVKSLDLGMCSEWKIILENNEIINTSVPSFPDMGSSQIDIDTGKNYYVKFLGTGKARKPLTFTVRQEIDRALCHYACGFSEKKKPRQIQEDDIIYLARMTENPINYSIFGKAEAVKFNEKRDRASTADIKERSWKKDWPIYLRVKNPIFIDGTLGDCLLLYDLIEELDYKSFPTTKKRYDDGERNINPYQSLSRQPYVRLTSEAVEWVEARFQNSLSRLGRVDDKFLNNLPQSDVII